MKIFIYFKALLTGNYDDDFEENLMEDEDEEKDCMIYNSVSRF